MSATTISNRKAHRQGRWVRLFSIGTLLALLSLGSVVSAEVAWPIGELDVQGTAVVTKQSGGSVTVSNGTYTWFSGDRIENRAGQSLLILDNGTSFGLGENTQATVSVNDGLTTVEIHQGSVLYTSPGDQELEFLSAGVVFANQVNNPPVCVLEPVGSVGLIQQQQDNEGHEVEVYEGTLYAAIDSKDGAWYALNPEAIYAVDTSSVQYIEQTQTASDASDGEAIPVPLLVCAGPNGDPNSQMMAATTTSTVSPTVATSSAPTIGSGEVAVGAFAVAVTAASVYVVAFRDDDEEVTEPPVSP